MIRALAIWRPTGTVAIYCCGKFGKTKHPGFAQLASPNWVGAGDTATSEFGEETSANSDKFGGFLSGYERFGRHDNSSVM